MKHSILVNVFKLHWYNFTSLVNAIFFSWKQNLLGLIWPSDKCSVKVRCNIKFLYNTACIILSCYHTNEAMAPAAFITTSGSSSVKIWTRSHMRLLSSLVPFWSFSTMDSFSSRTPKIQAPVLLSLYKHRQNNFTAQNLVQWLNHF